MAPIRYTPSEEEEEEEEEKVEENLSNPQNPHKQQSTKQSHQQSESESEDSSEEEETPPMTPVKNLSAPNPISTLTPPPPQSSSADEGDSESDPSASDFTVKPILSKPAGNSGNLSKPKKVAPKRPAEAQNRGELMKGKKARVSNGDEEDGGVEEKKFAINRLWSEEDEIALLQGMIDYQSKKGIDPYADLGAFHGFVKGLVHVEVSKNQLTDKIRRLKRKYQNNADKGENGEDPVFSRPHEYKSFALSKKIWGSGNSNGVDDVVKSSNHVKARKGGKVDNVVGRSKEDSKANAIQDSNKDEVKDEVKNDDKDFWSMYPQLYESLNFEKSIYLSLPEGGRDFLKENMSLIGSKNARELNKKWKNYFVGELGVYTKKLELIAEQTKLVLDAMKSSMA